MNINEVRVGMTVSFNQTINGQPSVKNSLGQIVPGITSRRHIRALERAEKAFRTGNRNSLENRLPVMVSLCRKLMSLGIFMVPGTLAECRKTLKVLRSQVVA
jgi:hypothetical protein